MAATGGVYTITEASNAGLFKAMPMPVGAQTLQFRFRFVSPGDGDFLSSAALVASRLRAASHTPGRPSSTTHEER